MRGAIGVFALCVTASPLAAQFARARVWPPGFTTQLALDTMALPEEVNAPPGKTYRAVIAAFDALKIPLDTRDSLRGLVGNLALTRMRTLAGSQLSVWLDCGSGMTGPNADSFRLYISIAALLDPIGQNRTRLRVAMTAGAQDVQGNAKEAVPCGSSGRLELKLVELIKARATAP